MIPGGGTFGRTHLSSGLSRAGSLGVSAKNASRRLGNESRPGRSDRSADARLVMRAAALVELNAKNYVHRNPVHPELEVSNLFSTLSGS